MILTLTPNPASDITCHVETVQPGDSHRVAHYAERAGGKGVNTAGILTSMGVDCLALAPVGAEELDAFSADLTCRGIRHQLTAHPGRVRKSIAVVDRANEATLYNQVGNEVPPQTWDELMAHIERLSPSASVLTVSGSLPPDSPDDLVAWITECAHSNGLKVILDVSGPALQSALRCAPELVKPNLPEAAATLDLLTTGPVSARAPARALVEAGASVSVVSDGAKGLSLVTGSMALRAILHQPLNGNPTRAGDALTAALATRLDGLADLPDGADAWAQALALGVAWSAAAVLQPVTGAIEPDDVTRLLRSVEIEEIRS